LSKKISIFDIDEHGLVSKINLGKSNI